VPSSLSLYNYKLSGITDGPLSFAKAMSEVASFGTWRNTELSRISVSREAVYEEHAGAGLLDVSQSQGSFDQMQGVTVTEADSELRQESMHSKTQIKNMQQQSVLFAEADLIKLQQENMQMKAEIMKMQQQQQENLQMKEEMKKMQQQLDLLATSARGANDLL
jgi:hypothetical protein